MVGASFQRIHQRHANGFGAGKLCWKTQSFCFTRAAGFAPFDKANVVIFDPASKDAKGFDGLPILSSS